MSLNNIWIISLVVLFNYAYNQIFVSSPQELRKLFKSKRKNHMKQIDGFIDVKVLNFGRVPYGYQTIGRLFWDPQNKDNELACKDIRTMSIFAYSRMESNLVMVDR